MKSALDGIEIAAPCPARWDDMKGDERRRFCDQCQLHVYDLSSMKRAEAQAFIEAAEAAEGRTCVRFYRRADGRVLTDDCPVGLAARARRTFRRAAVAVTGVLGLGLLGGVIERYFRAREEARPVVGMMCPRTVPTPTPTGGVATIVTSDALDDR